MTYRKRPRREYGQRRVNFRKLASRVPDIDDPRQINYWDFLHDKPIYVEGWADPCFSGTGLGEYDTQAKVNYAADLTPGILKRKEQEKGLKLLDGRFVETPGKDFIYGVTIGVYDLPVAYSSHGKLSTLGAIREAETERGNYFPDLPYPDDTPAIWVCPTRRKALRYLALAEDWDRIDDETQPLTPEEREMLEDVVEIELKPTDKIVHQDPDEGFLVIRPK